MDIALVIRQRLEELELEQKDLAHAADVTESYISQLLTRKKPPPAPNRTDIYEKMGGFLRLPSGELAKLATLQRQEELKRKLADPPSPLFREVREWVLRKCKPDKAQVVRGIFEKQPFGELERLITQKLLDVVKTVAKGELDNDNWVYLVARLGGCSYEQMRVIILEFLDTDIFHVSPENCASFLDPVIDSWDIDLPTFSIEVVLNRRVAPGEPKNFDFVEREVEIPVHQEPGLKEFLRDRSLSADVNPEEIEFLSSLRFRGKRPTALYFYRELQNLRDPLHFRNPSK